ncbi:hypothetical protein [Amycolatopsis sp. NPDC058986]|uniref:hypothetical protein n=1 Tax=unclassified Amycolatopsis TaxID=2618356 RepID=UPI00367232B3
MAVTLDVLAARFRCQHCAKPMLWNTTYWQLVCTNLQCSAFDTPIDLWRAQHRRVARGEDVPAPGPGWPRPLIDGRPHPWLVPVVDGIPCWLLLDGRRRQEAQQAWACQVCGENLPPRAAVILSARPIRSAYTVLTDCALHPRCVRLAAAACPHLHTGRARLTTATVRRSDILSDGHPLPDPVPRHAVAETLGKPRWTIPEHTVPPQRRIPLAAALANTSHGTP